jgi:hypothetical protein
VLSSSHYALCVISKQKHPELRLCLPHAKPSTFVVEVVATLTMSRSATPAGGRPASYYESNLPGVANVDHAHGAQQDNTYISGGLHDNESVRDGPPGLQRSNSQMSQSATYVPSRGGTLKKKAPLQKSGSLKRSGSKKSDYAGSVRSLRPGEKEKNQPEEYNNAFYCPIPTAGSPTELLSNRFQGMSPCIPCLSS